MWFFRIAFPFLGLPLPQPGSYRLIIEVDDVEEPGKTVRVLDPSRLMASRFGGVTPKLLVSPCATNLGSVTIRIRSATVVS